MTLESTAATKSVLSTLEILVATPVAFARDGELDIEGSRQIYRKVAESDAEGAFILGTTGEFVSLKEDEREILVAAASEELRHKRVVVHVGAASVWEVRRLIDQVRAHGLTDVAVLTPYYLPTSPDAVFRFFREISDYSDGLDVYAYVYADRSNNTVTPEELAHIAELPNLVGAKISGEDLDTIGAYIRAVPTEFKVFTGNDRDLMRLPSVGARGVVSGIASVFPAAFTELRQEMQTARIDEKSSRIAEFQAVVEETIDALLGDPARLKAALRLQGVNAGYARMPLDEPSGDVLTEIERVVAAYR